MKTDNRWPVGSLEPFVPDDAKAVYSARWIDHDTSMDVVPDRQGFAYDDPADRDRLIAAMEAADLRSIATRIDRDVATQIGMNQFREMQCWMRRAGGYVYVAAWIA